MTEIPLTKIQKTLKIILGLFLLGAGIGHLTWQRTEFLAQVPTWVPLDGDAVVILSGVIEILLGLGLTLLQGRNAGKVGLLTGLFFICIFPGNISQYMNHIDAFGLNSDQARFIRLLFQPILVIWALGSTGGLKELKALRGAHLSKS